jgi:hypothetical protein
MLPTTAAWRHVDVHDGFEVVFPEAREDGRSLRGSTSAVEDGQAWAVAYRIDVDARWHTRRAHVRGRSASGDREVTFEADGAGHWRVDGVRVPALDGCLDLDLESSACTNALPVQRLRLAPGAQAQAPAAYVRALDLSVERLEQDYARLADAGPGERYDYASPAFGFRCELTYDADGLVRDYPGIAVRVL